MSVRKRWPAGAEQARQDAEAAAEEAARHIRRARQKLPPGQHPEVHADLADALTLIERILRLLGLAKHGRD